MGVIKYENDLHPYITDKENIFGRIFGHRLKICANIDDNHLMQLEKYILNYHNRKIGIMKEYDLGRVQVDIGEKTKMIIENGCVKLYSRDLKVFNSVLNYFVGILPKK